jgi:sn1-specific diacylglycerol lipase
MPGIRLFGRRFNFSSDDLTFPSLIDITLRLPLLIIFIIFRIKYESSNSTCPSSFYIGYFYPLLSVYAVITIISSLICFVSLQGTPVNNTRPRRHMPFLIYIRLFLVLIDIGINIIGLIIIVQIFQICEFLLRGIIITSIVISYTAAIALFVILVFFIDLTGVVSAEKKWKMRIKFIFCCGRDYGNKMKNCIKFFFLLLICIYRWTIIRYTKYY